MSAPALGVGAQSLFTHGKPQAGVLFQRSSTVGLLFSVIPYAKSFLKIFVALAYRMSELSQLKWSFWSGIRYLDEAANVCSPGAGQEERSVLWKLKTTILSSGGGAATLDNRLWRSQGSKCGIERTERGNDSNMLLLLVALSSRRDGRFPRHRVAVQLECSPERRQFRRHIVAGLAGKPCLPSIARDRRSCRYLHE